MSRHIKSRKRHFVVMYLALLLVMVVGVERLSHQSPERLRSVYDRWRYAKEWKELAGVAPANAGEPEEVARPGLIVLLYHGIVEERDRFNLTKETFKDQMFALKRHGYRTVTLADLAAFRDGVPLPHKSVLLTFDDGRMDSYLGADPLLEALGFNAVMFVASGQSVMARGEKKIDYYIGSREIEEMISSGRWEIGSHMVQTDGGFIPVDVGQRGNFLSNKRWLADEGRLETDEEYQVRMTAEFEVSKGVLEGFGVPVETVSFPFGDDGSQQVNNPGAVEKIDAVARRTYQVAFLQTWPRYGEFTANRSDEDPMRMRRFETPTDWTGRQLVDFLWSALDKPLPYHHEVHLADGWRTIWGDLVEERGHVVLHANEKTTGAATMLDGTGGWEAYRYTAHIHRIKGSHVSLLGRWSEPGNYFACTFGDDGVRVDRTEGGRTVKLTDVRKVAVPAAGEVRLAMVVSGGTITCMVEGEAVVSAFVPHGRGGIGLKIWDETPNNAEVKLLDLRVEER